MHTKSVNRNGVVVPKQLQKQSLEENHSGIMHVAIPYGANVWRRKTLVNFPSEAFGG